jgi:hypothetical protein
LRARGYADTLRSFELPVRHAIDLIYSLEPVAPAVAAVAPLVPAPGVVAPTPALVAPTPAVVAPTPAVVAPTPAGVAPTPAGVAPAPVLLTPAPVAVAPTPAVVAPTLPPVAAATTSLSALPPAAQEPAEVRWWTWTVLGGSAAALIGAGAFELSRRHLESEASSHDLEQPDIPDTWDTMLSRRTASRVFLGTGLVLGALGGVSLYFDLRRKEGGTDVGIACADGECTAFTRGYW